MTLCQIDDCRLIDFEATGTTEDNRNRNNAGYVYAIDRHSAPTDLEVTNGNTITWRNLDMNAGQKFRTIIKVDISQTVADDESINDTADDRGTEDDGLYPFVTQLETVGLEATKDADLYAVRGDNDDVMFQLINTDAVSHITTIVD